MRRKPITFFDIETTGTDKVKDRIVEITTIKFQDQNTSLVSIAKTWRINPGMPIPEEATKIHGITNEMVKDQPRFYEVAKEILATFEGTDIGTYNGMRFDIPFLLEEFMRNNIKADFPESNAKMLDGFKIFSHFNPRTLTAAYNHYTGKDLEKAHSAEADTEATKEVLLAQIEAHFSEDENSIETMDKISRGDKEIIDWDGKLTRDSNDLIVFAFGKHVGKSPQSEYGYCQWIMNGDFTLDTKDKLQQVLAGRLK